MSRFLTVFFFVIAPVAAALPAPLPAADRVERGNLVIEGIPEIPAEVLERQRQYQNARSAGFSGWHPGGEGLFITTRFGETSQVHWVRTPGGARHQMTFFDEPVAGANPSPDPQVNGFLFGKDVGGSEFFQLFFFDLETGESRLLTDGTSRNGGGAWAEDGKRFAFFTTRRNGHDWDIHVADVTKAVQSKAVLEKPGVWFPGGWSPDGTRLLVARFISANETEPHLLDLASGELTRLGPEDEQVAYGNAQFSRDGTGIYLTSDHGSEVKHLRYFDLASGETTVLTAEIPWDVEGLDLSKDGRYLAFTVNEGGISRLVLREPASGRETRPRVPEGSVFGLSFSPDSKHLAMVINSARSPGDVYSLELATAALTRWTTSEVGGLDTESFVAPALIEYPTFDGREIPAFYSRPPGDGPFPVLIQIHGGPEGQVRPVFSPTNQYLLRELGVALLAPNVRGSSGYGKSYLKLDNGVLREDSVKDIGALLDWVETRPELDAERVAVMGGSYGGYMVLASMVHFNDRLRCGVDVVGISNFVTFLENTQEYRRDLRRVEYGDERDEEMRAFLEKVSPNNRADEITRPLLIVQGLNDPRVPVTESEQMVEVIREGGGEVWYLMARDEGHGFRKKSNRDYFEGATALFLRTFLLDAGGEEGSESAAGGAR